jgi:hypothetical protein
MRRRHTGLQLVRRKVGSFFCSSFTIPVRHSWGIFPVLSASLMVSRSTCRRQSGADLQSSGGYSSLPAAFLSLMVRIIFLSSIRSMDPLSVSPEFLGMTLPAVNIFSSIGSLSYVLASSYVFVSILHLWQYWCTVRVLFVLFESVEKDVPLHTVQVVHFARALLPSSDSMADSMLVLVVSGVRCLIGVVSCCCMSCMCSLLLLQYLRTERRWVWVGVCIHVMPLWCVIVIGVFCSVKCVCISCSCCCLVVECSRIRTVSGCVLHSVSIVGDTVGFPIAFCIALEPGLNRALIL